MPSRRALLVGFAGLAWIVGFALLRRWGSVLPLFAMALALAVAMVAWDSDTRRLLKPELVPLASGGGAAIVMIAATYLLYPLFARSWPPLRGEVHGLYQLLFRGQDRAGLAALVAAMSICEEILFRGWLLTPATRRSRVAQFALVSLFYAAIHVMSGSALLVVLAFVCGLTWGLLRRLTDSLWTSIVCHVAWDLAIMVIAPLA